MLIKKTNANNGYNSAWLINFKQNNELGSN